MFRRERIYAFRHLPRQTRPVEWKKEQHFRRECIYAFRNVIVIYLVGWMVKHYKYVYKNTIQRTAIEIQRCGTHKCVPYAHVVTFPIQRTLQIPIYRLPNWVDINKEESEK